MLRHVCLRGTDIKLMSTAESGSQSVMCPYPAFKWAWKVRLSFAWRQEQHINVLEVSTFLVEFRRRTRQIHQLGTRFFNITDSQVMFHCLSKGRSSSPRLNRLLRESERAEPDGRMSCQSTYGPLASGTSPTSPVGASRHDES